MGLGLILKNKFNKMGIGDWGLGIGPNPQSPIPNPQSPIPILLNLLFISYYKNKINKTKIYMKNNKSLINKV
jgi:hypothetical protein